MPASPSARTISGFTSSSAKVGVSGVAGASACSGGAVSTSKSDAAVVLCSKS
ncbi:hypothetical protein SACE_1061 [Saccharopolyspora erythraea NRRL 2338]|uniref:Uncharacterized protein n=1 Tax=Saccharopolyspora erythraea (strain ATCC 11635 / DSM 40517 / JCM 4748 / NBRC 13426 / NCIMB 8594 / NRRL 2338) TaxID=405948 RepID=A4F8L8_SACEN|nr:hypothetical protein N599_12055 [Saccharopolyspora erythraea D]CAM00393.1 hypothetical protein SACE_1061 [Saccharopolyspora erythraea NRRL 2338]